mmetsp:Transcript_64925/g.128345  ORF Transcript_64925/g.128345 Transcript_64925/m.128345 type:complete len:183 (-) Transcript_64925:265-813(-)
MRHPRAERQLRGILIVPHMANELLSALRSIRWPASSARPGVSADDYLVLSTRRSAESLGARHPHYELRRLCDELIAWHHVSSGLARLGLPRFAHTAIAVTRNFVGSPHIDHFDVGPQLALSLGNFEGGELCVEEASHNAIAVVDTHSRLAEVDGRRVHWVRAFRGERFSLIFYRTAEVEGPV